MNQVTFRIDKELIEITEHFKDPVKCAAITSILYFAQGVLQRDNQLKSYERENGYTRIKCVTGHIVFEVLKETLREYKNKWPKEIKMFDNEVV